MQNIKRGARVGVKKCEVKYCKRKAAKMGKKCPRCHMREWRAKNPMLASYYNLKANAKKRGKPFELTVEQFEKFCYKENYLKGKGRSKHSFTIDCIINELGYVEGNIRAIPKLENCQKGTKMLVYNWQTREASYIRVNPVENPIF